MMTDHGYGGPVMAIDRTTLRQICDTYAIRKLLVFGSALRDDFRADSDLDLLVEFEANARIGWEFIEIQDALTELFGYPVDLHTPQSLNKYFRERVLQTAQVIYEREG